jgi:RNA polymerase sigma-70 factor (ECF subfamily)
MTFLRTDEELAVGVQKGNKADLAVLVERHHSPLIGFLYRMTDGDRALAEDLAQESFLRVLRAIRQYQYPRPFKPWLYQIATNLARDHYKLAEMRYTDSIGDEFLVEPVSLLPEAALLSTGESDQVVTAIRSLPMHQRETLILRYLQELSLAEIAEITGVPVGTVKSRLSLALARLRDQLVKDEA